MPTRLLPVVRTLHPPPLTQAEVCSRETYGDAFFDEHEKRHLRAIRAITFRCGVEPNDANVHEIHQIAWERICRKGQRRESIIARYNPLKNPAATVMDPLAAFDRWLHGRVTFEATLAARNMRRRTSRERARWEQDNGAR
jgi:hypothetical protein